VTFKRLVIRKKKEPEAARERLAGFDELFHPCRGCRHDKDPEAIKSEFIFVNAISPGRVIRKELSMH
jgi:hypothetical protein